MDYPRLVADYARYHTTPGNRRMHAIGVPLIVFAIVKWSQVGSVFPLAALVLPVYFVWDKRLGWLIGGFIAASAAAKKKTTEEERSMRIGADGSARLLHFTLRLTAAWTRARSSARRPVSGIRRSDGR